MAPSRIDWHKNSATQWATRDKRGFVGTINFAANVYTLTWTGTGNPGTSTHDTLGKAKNTFRKFIRTKSPT